MINVPREDFDGESPGRPGGRDLEGSVAKDTPIHVSGKCERAPGKGVKGSDVPAHL